MPDIAPAAPPVDLVALIPAQRDAADVEPVVAPDPVPPAPERLAFLWTLLGALAGSAVVAVAFLVLITLLP